MAADLDALDSLLSGIGWTRERMERATGLPVAADMPQERKRLIWAVIRDRETREVLSRWRVWFPGAVICGICVSDSRKSKTKRG